MKIGSASKVKMQIFGSEDFHVVPQRGYGLQPRVAASATLGTSKKNFNRNAVASFSQREMHKADATALRLRTRSLLPRVAEAATLGWRPYPVGASLRTYRSRLGNPDF